jgi:ribosomal protein S18 acetylase RimI-like enzyme
MGHGAVFGYTRLCVWSIALPAELQLADGPSRYRPAASGEVGELAAMMGVPVATVEARQTWSRCYTGRAGGDLACYGWVSEAETPVGEVGASIRPSEGEAYVWDCHTAPALRRRGLYRDLLRQIVADLSREGFHRVWIATLERNHAGSRGVERAGFHPVLRIRYFWLGPWRWGRVRPDRHASGEEIVAARRALRSGRLPERAAPTRPSGAPPAPVESR